MREGSSISWKKENYHVEQNKTNVRRLFDELWNKGDLAVAAGSCYHLPGRDPVAGDADAVPEGERKKVKMYRTGISRSSIDD